ncbi:hypothetical protein QQ045_023578 [Rhodiola kirilowii]
MWKASGTDLGEDIRSNDRETKSEMKKQFVDLLTEELKLQEKVAEEHSCHMNNIPWSPESKREASQYQKEAKSAIFTGICEGQRVSRGTPNQGK